MIELPHLKEDGTTPLGAEDACTYWSNVTMGPHNSMHRKHERKEFCKSTYTKDNAGRYYRCIFPKNTCITQKRGRECTDLGPDTPPPPTSPSPSPPPFPPPFPPPPPSLPWSCQSIDDKGYDSLRDHQEPKWCEFH